VSTAPPRLQGEQGREEQGAGTTQLKGKMDDDTFENLEIWQDAFELAAHVYELFRDCRDFGFRDQIRNAASSVSNNIAEGYERDSNQEFIRFLFIAKGSCGEVRSQSYLARRVGLLPDTEALALVVEAKRLSRRIMKLIQTRRRDF
jgi:four helix bundle protein